MSLLSPLETDHGFPPSGAIFPVRSVTLRVNKGAHPWYLANTGPIAANWQAEVAANPKLYDGQMVFQHRLSFSAGHIAGEAHMVPFSTFLHWRRNDRESGGFHLFAMPLMLSTDGALIAIRMAEGTANPGRVYCAAGSMDAHDVVDGACDLDSNMRREVREETGLDLDDAEADPVYYATHGLNTVTIFRIFRFPLTEEELLARIAAHVAADPDPEISAAVAIRSADPDAHDYAFFMLPILDWLFTCKE
jgi:8-oxo-dGTP pyrophosphatase MutT (NUDIX family)